MQSPTPAVNDRLIALGTSPLRKPVSLLELLKRPEVHYAELRAAFGGTADARVAERVEIRGKYEGYIARQSDEAGRLTALDGLPVPSDLDFASLAGLSREVKEKLARVRPRSIGQASRIPGVTPAAVSILIVHAKAGARRPTGVVP